MKFKFPFRRNKNSKKEEHDSSELPGIRTFIRADPDEIYEQIKKLSNYSDFWTRYEEQISGLSLSDYLSALLKEKKLKRSDVVVKTGLDKAYVYQIFAGKKNPSRDKLITMAFGLKLSEKETQKMLRLSKHRELWTQDERDAFFLFAIQHKMSLADVHTELERYGLAPLASPVK